MSPRQGDFHRESRAATGIRPFLRSAAAWAMPLLVASGCALGRHRTRQLDPSEGRLLARPPDFLTGPVSILLTNREDFSAHLVVSSAQGAWQNVWPVSGNLFQQQGRLLFVPTVDESAHKNSWAGSFRFLWDVQGNRG